MEKYIKQTSEEVREKEENNVKKIVLSNKKSLFIGSGIVVLLGMLAYFFRGGTEVQVKTGVGTEEVKGTVTEIIKPVYQQQEEIKKTQEETRKSVENLNSTIQELNKAIEQLKEREKQDLTSKNVMPPEDVMPKEIIQGSSGNVNINGQVNGLVNKKTLFNSIEVTSEEAGSGAEMKKVETEEDVKKKTQKKPSVYIPAGSIVEGKLMYGFVAPESGMFPPVVVEFEKPIRTANDFYIPAQKCLVTTSAQYDVSQGLAILGGVKSTLSCVLKSGKVVEVPVNIAVGEEIKGQTVQVGLSGEEKWLTGKDFATLTSMVALSGMANSYQQGLVQQNMTTTGNVLTSIENRGLYSILGGINAGINKFTEFWLKKYDKKVPAIQVKPDKRIFVVFVDGADLKVSPEEL